MKLGIIGLGRMGHAVAYRAHQTGHEVIGFDLDKKTRDLVNADGIECADSLQELAQKCRVIWLMVPSGDPVDGVINQLLPTLQAGDILIDGGNSNYKDSIRRATSLADKKIFFLDCGTSGGVHGRAHGFCLMIGGDKAAYLQIHPLLVAIASPDGITHVGPSGAGHYVKMIHNGIEYGLLQAYAEGFHLIKEGTFKDAHINLEELSRVWNDSSIIRSFILELAHNVFVADQDLDTISGDIGGGSTGRWTIEEAHEQNIPAQVIEKSLEIRDESQKTGGNYATKIVAMLRNQFGGHTVTKKE